MHFGQCGVLGSSGKSCLLCALSAIQSRVMVGQWKEKTDDSYILGLSISVSLDCFSIPMMNE